MFRGPRITFKGEIMVRIEQHETDVILWGSMIGTTFNENDQCDIIKWFMQNKPSLIKECRKDIRSLKNLKTALSTESP